MSALLLQRSLNVTTTDTSRARTFYPFCVFFWVFCLFAILLSVLQITASDFPNGIFKLCNYNQYIIDMIFLSYLLRLTLGTSFQLHFQFLLSSRYEPYIYSEKIKIFHDFHSAHINIHIYI